MTSDQVTVSCEHISFHASSVQVVNQSSVYGELRTWLFLTTFFFHHHINDGLDADDHSYIEDLACHGQVSFVLIGHVDTRNV